MTTEDQIQSLLAHAAPLRELADDDPNKAPLAGIVDEINRLRAVQEKQALQGEPVAATLSGAHLPHTSAGEPIPDGMTQTYHAPSAFDATEEGADAAPVTEPPAEPPKRRGGRPRKEPKQ